MFWFLIFLIVCLCLVILYLLKRNKTKDVIFNYETITYARQDFPINVFFQDLRPVHKQTGLARLRAATEDAIRKYNETFQFEFFKLESCTTEYPNTMSIRAVCGDHGCVIPFDGHGGVLAHSYYPPVRMMCVDCDDMDDPNLPYIILHEFGHTLGFDHVDEKVAKSIMNPYSRSDLKTFTAYDRRRMYAKFKFLT